MISQIITEKLTSLSLDTSTIAALAFSVFLVIYFFAKIKPAIDSNNRVRRQVQRREERDKANAIYQKKHPQKLNQQPIQNNQPFKKRVYTAKQKSYYAYLRKNPVRVNSGNFGQIKTTSENAYSKKVINGILNS